MKKINVEGGESRWVNFKYERLSNFCYGCGLLNHAIKDCREGWAEKSRLEEESLQYGAWLRRDTWRRNGWASTQVGTGRKSVSNQKVIGEGLEKQTELSRLAVAGDGSGKSHV